MSTVNSSATDATRKLEQVLKSARDTNQKLYITKELLGDNIIKDFFFNEYDLTNVVFTNMIITNCFFGRNYDARFEYSVFHNNQIVSCNNLVFYQCDIDLFVDEPMTDCHVVACTGYMVFSGVEVVGTNIIGGTVELEVRECTLNDCYFENIDNNSFEHNTLSVDTVIKFVEDNELESSLTLGEIIEKANFAFEFESIETQIKKLQEAFQFVKFYDTGV